MSRNAQQSGDTLSKHHHAQDWDRARLDLVNVLIQLAPAAEDEQQAAFVLRTAVEACEAGLISTEETTDITLIANARIGSLRRRQRG